MKPDGFQHQLVAAILAEGITPPALNTIRADGKITRFPSSGKAHDDAGWFVLRSVNGGDIVAGAFGDYRTGVNKKFRSHSGKPLTAAEETAVRDGIAAAQREREVDEHRRHATAAKLAASIWKTSKRAARHPYLTAKGCKPCGAHVQNDKLLVAAFDSQGVIRSVQEIYADGTKRFLKDTTVKGCWFPIGNAGSDPILICEGFATGASLNEATGHAVAVAFHAGNLLVVAQELRKLYPSRMLIVCGDDDID